MKTIRTETIEPVYGMYCPPKEEMVQGHIYISNEYETSNHLCLCGCGEECPLPIGKDGWEHKIENGKITITPSILQRFKCKSHYIITNGKANFV